ncbi:MAG: response regulator transcription factor [Caldilineaceae bacterium]
MSTTNAILANPTTQPVILIVEDEPALVDTLQYSLQRLNYQVVVANDGVAGIEKARSHKPDLIILDLMLPKLDGFEVCRILRQEMSTPILMLTARVDEIDKIVGLEVGADDYLTKPFSMRELIARVKAQLRRVRLVREEAAHLHNASEMEEALAQLKFGNLVIDTSRHEILLDGKALHVKPKEYELLLFFARNRRIALSREIILERVWGWEYDGGSRTVDVHVRWLREKIESDPTNATRIVTVRGSGYRFEG